MIISPLRRRLSELKWLIMPPKGFDASVELYCTKCYETADRCVGCRKVICPNCDDREIDVNVHLCRECADAEFEGDDAE